MKLKPPQGHWNIKKNVINDAKKYQLISDWRKSYPGAYESARRNNWIEECRKYFKSRFSVKYGHWQNKQRVFVDAKKYKTRIEWAKNSPAAYHSARKNDWLKKCCKHMTIRGCGKVNKTLLMILRNIIPGLLGERHLQALIIQPRNMGGLMNVMHQRQKDNS
ncbi:MAG TPA: hypothetical protein VKR58_09130 [Aquella sp.]|nr:hypothetical protein [Aquella sp.]